MSERRCACPACQAAAAVTLLEDDRPAMALRLLRGLPEAIREAVAAAREAGVREGRKRARPSPVRTNPMPTKVPTSSAPATGKPAFRREAAELRGHVERLGAERVAEVLTLRPSDLGPLLEGRVAVARAALRRLRKTA